MNPEKEDYREKIAIGWLKFTNYCVRIFFDKFSKSNFDKKLETAIGETVFDNFAFIFKKFLTVIEPRTVSTRAYIMQIMINCIFSPFLL